MVVLRTKISGMRFFYILFVCVIDIGLLCYYVIMSGIRLCGQFDLDRFVRAIILRFRDTNDNGWLRFRLCSCGAVGVVF